MRKITIIFILFFLLSTSPVPMEGDNDDKVKNIILMIGDGMGSLHVKLASYIEYGNDSGLFMQNPDFVQTSIKTSSADRNITDSAAAATALASGIITDDAYLGMAPNRTIFPTILEYAEELDKSTGLVTNVLYYAATPAAFAVHQRQRTYYPEIKGNMTTAGIEVIFGGGNSEPPSQKLMENEGYTYITTKEELLAIEEPKVFGLFTNAKFKYESELDYNADIRLPDIVPATLDLLNQNPNGFFTMIEGGLIDYAGHEQNFAKAMLEVIQFDEAIKQVYDWVQDNPDTLVIVTADHETGWLVVNSTDGLDNQLPDPSGSNEDKRSTRKTRALQIDATMLSASHSADDVSLFAFGKGASTFIDESCVYRNAHVYKIMKNAFDGVVPTSCPTPILAWPDYVTINPWIPPQQTTRSTEEESGILSIPTTIGVAVSISLISKKRKKY